VFPPSGSYFRWRDSSDVLAEDCTGSGLVVRLRDGVIRHRGDHMSAGYDVECEGNGAHMCIMKIHSV